MSGCDEGQRTNERERSGGRELTQEDDLAAHKHDACDNGELSI